MGLALGAIYMHRIAALFITVLMIGCSNGKITPGPKSSTGVQWQKLSSAHLPNASRLHPKVISRGQTEGLEAFRELQSLGVRTVISVDDTRLDFVKAARFTMRYVHIPHGKDGISPKRAKELVKAVRDLDGPIYIQCHHGKQCGPTAVVAYVGSGLMRPKGPQNGEYRREVLRALPICRIGAQQKFRDVPLGQQQGRTSASAGAGK